MRLSHDVKLRYDVSPVWPPACVGCGAPDPAHALHLDDRRTTMLTTVVMVFAPRITVTAPACEPCARRLTRRHRLERVLRAATGIGGALVGLGVVAPAVAVGPPLVWALGCGLGAYAPVVAWRILAAPDFEIQAWADEVTYEFGDEAYAQAFAALNGASVT
jgi:hypothetical protein